MPEYTHLFFDLDRTLWDYDVNATETLYDLIDRYQIINGYPIDKEGFVEEFFKVNEDLWARFDEGLIDKNYIRSNRFPLLLGNLRIQNFDQVENLQTDFIMECPTKGKLVKGAHEIVERLAEEYSMYIITNGFDDIQHIKMKYSGLEGYFEEIITSETARIQKPDPRIFDYAVTLSNAEKSKCLMIGDNFDSDILGARQASIDQVHFNPEKTVNAFIPTYEITSLDQLADILL